MDGERTADTIDSTITPATEAEIAGFSDLPFPEEDYYLYSSLSKRQTRVVVLHPSDAIGDLQCSLRTVEISDFHDYEALSYVWGDPKDSILLKLDECLVTVTRNLSAALCELRLPSTERVLWIDQLCIDQTDYNERANQVEIMGAVYKQAKLVICWLGPDFEGEAYAGREIIQQLAKTNLREYERGVVDLHDDSGKIDDGILQSKNLPLLDSPTWVALNHLLQRPYFERVWIMQEIKIATSKILLWGDFELIFTDLQKVATWALNIGRHALMQESLLDIGAATRVVSLLDTTETFEQCLSAAALRKSTDERDKVFGILGLVSGGVPFPAWYQATELETHSYTCLYLLQNRNSFQFMSHIDNTNHIDDLEWPSWIPRHWKGAKGPGEADFQAATTFPNTLAKENAMYLNVDTSFITVIGIKHAIVKTLGSINNANNPNSKISEIENTALKVSEAWRLMRAYQGNVYRDINEPQIKAFIRTIVCGALDLNDISENQDPLLPDTNIYFAEFIKFWNIILTTYLGLKGQDVAAFVKQNISLSKSAANMFLGACSLETESELEGEPYLLQQMDDSVFDKTTKAISQTANLALTLAFVTAKTLTVVEELLQNNLSQNLADLPEVQEAGRAISTTVFISTGIGWQSFTKMWYESGLHKRFFITDNGFMGMGPEAMREGDITAVIFGGTVPFILRLYQNGWRVIGSCYIHGVMHGEFIHWMQALGTFDSMVEEFELR